MSEDDFSGVTACFFDAYGTLFDVHAPVARVASKIGAEADAVSRLWRLKQLEYTWLRSLMGEHAVFWQVTGEALDYALAAHWIDDRPLREELMDLYLTLDAYPDAVQALADLKAAGFTTGILSNGSPGMLNAAVKSSGLADHLDHALSIEDVGIYKPDRRVYQMVIDCGAAAGPDEVCFVSANTWDAQAAANFGFQVARINRFGLIDENIPGRPKRLLNSLEELPAALARKS
jgi:2-haloacid dehalogenase